ncbi:MAG: hypothetical protein E7043_06285 [Lentisphaerae bacterium]|nr:hypothetical protein [Lentisphaerota bacterium]
MVKIGKTGKDGLFPVCFSYAASPGHTVSLAGVFNDWDPIKSPMKFNPKSNLYEIALRLPSGDYEYKLVVDGQWLPDEGNPNFVSNDFGTLNSIIRIK